MKKLEDQQAEMSKLAWKTEDELKTENVAYNKG